MTEILVLGAGYAGMAAAVSLAGRLKKVDDVRVTLVNASERFTERLRLHQVASGQTVADLRIPALLEGTGAAFVRGWVTGLDADARTVRIDDERELRYDTLVYALGAVADTDTVPGATDHADTLDSLESANTFATRLATLAANKPATATKSAATKSAANAPARSEPPADMTAATTSAAGKAGGVVVCGGGLTGIEAAAEIAEAYPELSVTLVGRDEPGSTLSPKARSYIHAALARLGVHIMNGRVAAVQPDAVQLDNGETVPADLILWTSGVRVSPLAAKAGLDTDDQNRIVTDGTLRSVSHPDIYAVGDAAAVRQTFGTLHGTCQSGMPTGVFAAAAIVRARDGKAPKPFRFGYFHTPISLGRRDAVVQFTNADDTPKRLTLTGRAARWYKETVSAAPWPTFGRTYRAPALAMAGWRR